MMMAEAYKKLGGETHVFGETNQGPASFVADKIFVGDPSKLDDFITFFKTVDVVTLENEFYDSQLLIEASAQSNTAVLPNPNKFHLIEDKLSENLFFRGLGINIADFFEVKSEQDLIDEPGYLKLAKGGYDGIGTYRVSNKQQAIEIFNTIKSAGTVLFEYAVDFKKELSLIAVTNSTELVFYPLVETFQESGTCRYVSYPAGVSADIEAKAQQEVQRVMEAFDTRGLIAFEFFLTQDDKLILNESAPRPHNSGHITMDSMDCSQFENHMRAVADLPLKQPQALKESMTMVNLLGTQNAEFDANKLLAQLDDQDLAVTLYRKKQTRIKRKMGHINLWGSEQRSRAENIVATLEV